MNMCENQYGIALELNNIAFSYGNVRALKEINLEIPKGKYVSLIGPNGSGKTTLFNLLCGAEKPELGVVMYDGQEVYSLDSRDRAKEFAVIHQKNNINFPFTCIEFVILGLHPHRKRFEKLSAEHLKKIESLMKLTGTYQFANKLITQISGGELQRVLLAKALAQSPRILFMDEAMSDMDINAKIKMVKILRQKVEQEGLTVVAINHDINIAYRFSDYIVALKDGKIAAKGFPKEVMTENFFSEVFRVKVKIFENNGFFIIDDI